jgi:flagellar hook protein FlgE
MLGSIYTALSGMNAYSDGLQTISYNVANLNTDGFKASDVAFNALVSNGNPAFLGENSLLSGYGVRMASAFRDFSQGQLQQTGNGLDLAIQGSGFLTVFDNNNVYYERTGRFSVGADGYISDANGNHLAVLNADNQPEALNINGLRTDAPSATTKIAFNNNVSSSGTTATVSNITVYDSQGGQHVWTVTLSNPTPNSGGTGTNWTATVTENGTTVGTGTVGFIGGSADPAKDTVSITKTVAGASDLSVALDFSAVTSYSAGTTSTIATSSVDGNALGTLTNVTVDASGQVQIAYSNGNTKPAGAVALANFQDLQKLELLSGGIFRNPNGGGVQYFASGAPGIGTLQSGQLEASNVNLSNEFGALILIERGYQACAHVVSVSNDLIQTLFGIRGQGVG